MKTTREILRKPCRLFMLTGVGLISALVSDGVGDVLGWACLAYVVGAGIRLSLSKAR